MKTLVVHPGTQHAAQLAEQLEKNGCLFRLWTGWARPGESGSRRCVALPPEKLRTRLWIEIYGTLLQRCGFGKETGWQIRNRLFQKLVPEKEILEADVVVGFDTASDILAERCRVTNRPLVLDQTTPRRSFKSKIMQELGISSTHPASTSMRVLQGERMEQLGATKIVVASSFCRKSFEDEEKLFKKTVVVPYGIDPTFHLVGDKRKYGLSKKPLRFLFVGNLGRHKGIETLIQAWRQTRSLGSSCRVVGSGSVEIENNLRKNGFELAGKKNITGVAEEMAEADVLVFPSYFEGFGRVILEAMAAGLAVITTYNTGGPDVIGQGKEGRLVSAGNVKELAEAMVSSIRDPAGTAEMGQRAHRRAAGLTWKTYGGSYLQILKKM